MFGWFRKKTPPPAPETEWAVSLDGERIGVGNASGLRQSVAKAELSAVIVATEDGGPAGIGLRWLLFGPDGALACAVPAGAAGEADLIGFVSALPGFRHDRLAQALRSTAKAMFPLWRKGGETLTTWLCLGGGPGHLADMIEVARHPHRGPTKLMVQRCRTCGQLYRAMRSELNDWSAAGDFSDETLIWQRLDPDEVPAVLEDFNYQPRSERMHRIDRGWQRDGPWS